jgi:drug/metabolite transporter (DMT)-like permease
MATDAGGLATAAPLALALRADSRLSRVPEATQRSAAPRAQLPAVLALLAVTAAWGSTFYLIKDIVSRLPVADLLAVRFAIASGALLIFSARRLRVTARTIRQGALLGLLYGVAQILQTVGLAHTAASASGFITGLYVVVTPLLAALILRTRIAALTWVAVGLAGVGLGVLSLNGFSAGYGELLTFGSAVIYAAHIVALSRLSDRRSSRTLALVKMVVITIVCTIAAQPGGVRLPGSSADWVIVAYLGVVAGALTMFLQTWAQAHIEASRAAVIMAMEPVWAALFAVTLGGESITLRMIIGGLAILTAMYLVELAPRLSTRRPYRPTEETVP